MKDNKTLIESLNKHLSKVDEVGENSPVELEKLIMKKANGNAFGKLVWAMIKPTVVAQSGKYVKPNFNEIKPLIVKDLKDSIAIMTKEDDMTKEEAIGYLLDPAQYDDEIGNYADCTFADGLIDIIDAPGGAIVGKFEDEMVDFLDKEIKKNYKQFIQAVK